MKSGRTLSYTINELMNSPRMRIAVDNFDNDKLFLKALLTELCMEVFNVTKYSVIKRYNTHSSLTQADMLPLLRSLNTDDLTTFNIYFNLSPMEMELYKADPLNKKTKEEKNELFQKVYKMFMESK